MARGGAIERSLLIFAGGRATRLNGVNKALLDVGGLPIVERILGSLGPLVSERVLLANDSALAQLDGVRVVYDPEPHAGVLPALAAGLAAASGELCLAVACDMPFVTVPLLRYLLSLAPGVDAVVPRTKRGYHPLCAVYTAACQTPVTRRLASGQLTMIGLLDDLQVRAVAPDEFERFGGSERLLANVNTRAELEQLQTLAAHNP